ncbi:MAG TPA: hypothetical protein VFA12_20370 [Stellaceae bacterium]|nr:hypothetical protein [Stellaceae bacterium]
MSDDMPRIVFEPHVGIAIGMLMLALLACIVALTLINLPEKRR